MLDPAIAARLKRDPSGLIAAIAQQYDTGEVLMLGWMDEVLDDVEALVHAGQSHQRQRRRPRPDRPHQAGKRRLLLDMVLHPRRVPGQRPAEDARGGVGPVLAEHQVRGEVAGVPASAQRRGVRSRLVEQRAQR